MKKILSAVLAAMFLLMAAVVPASAQATTATDSYSLPVVMFSLGCGEWVRLRGDIHVVTHSTVDAQGGVHVSSHFNPQGIVGIGQSSGNEYHGVGVTRSNANSNGPFPAEYSYQNVFRLINTDGGQSLHLHVLIHKTVSANGQTTSFVDQYWLTCQ